MTTTRTPSSTRPLEHADGFGLLLNSLRPSAPPAFQIAPGTPDVAALRQAAADSVGYTPAPAEEAAHEYSELSLDDFRSLIGLGDLVLYDCEGCYRFEGIVEELNFEADKALVVWNDGFATRRSWLGFARLALVLKKAARDVESEAMG